MRLRLSDDDVTLKRPVDDPPPRSHDAYQPLVRRYAADVARKHAVAKWIDSGSAAPLIAAATADETPDNTAVALYLADLNPDQDMDDDPSELPPPNPRLLTWVHHEGDALGLAVGGASELYTASGAGGVYCFRLAHGSEAPELHAGWAAPLRAPTLGVAHNEPSHKLAAVSEEGTLHLLDAATGKQLAEANARDSCLFGAHWRSPNELATVGSAVLLWDCRAATPAAVARFEPAAEGSSPQQLGPQLHCAATEPLRKELLAAGSSSGDVFFWDERLPGAAASVVAAHGADVWHAAFCQTGYGSFFTCSSDGALLAWHDDADGADGAPAPSRALLQYELPVNSFDVSAEHGALVVASDAEELAVLDLRA